MKLESYKALGLIVGIHFFIMYALVFAPVNALDDIKLFNLRNLYKALIMVTPMIILMLVLMNDMFQNKKINNFLYWASAIAFVLTFFFIRQQVFVGDEQFIKSMIPHHSSAITMCQEASLTDVQLRNLCSEIIASQQREIDEMNMILDRLER
jgi:uncharacterized membrane protein YjfL (UPF0719 family)